MGAAGGVEEEEEKSCCGSQLLLEDMKSKEKKNSNSNGWLLLPPGFRFHPTDEELVLYYLKRKILRRHIHLPSIVGDVDVYKWQPWELPAALLTTTTTTSSSSSSSRDELKQWYLFSPRDRKYPNGSRSNRSTQFGHWKSTGKDRPITTRRSGSRRTTVGNKKTLVYYHGRAPRGQRTDWLMHEYTLLLDDTDTANYYDCYALYKLFRKSGPGPKNGEHYGAPFQEEDWEDDVDDIFNKRTPPTTSKQAVQVDTNATLPDYNLEQVLLRLSRELDVDRHSQVEQAVVQSGDQLLGLDATTSVQHTTNAWWEQGAGETSNQIAPSSTSVVVCARESLETPEVTTSLIGCPGAQGQIKTDEEFLEIADFGDPGSVVWSTEDNSNHVCLPNDDGLYDPYDDYFDAEMYLAEALEPLDGANLYLDDFGEENQAASHMITELWTHEQDFSFSAATTEPTTSVSAASGVLSNNGSFSDIGGGDAHQEPISDSWLSSALSAFLDSVPSSPAIAAESPLISKALQRVSSFRTPGGAAAAAAATGNGRSRRRRGGTNNRGFLFISFLVGLGAVFCVLTNGISVKIIKGIWSRLS